MIVPPLRIRDNLELKPGDYQMLLKGVQVGAGSLMVGHLLAMDPGNVTEPIAGVPTREGSTWRPSAISRVVKRLEQPVSPSQLAGVDAC